MPLPRLGHRRVKSSYDGETTPPVLVVQHDNTPTPPQSILKSPSLSPTNTHHQRPLRHDSSALSVDSLATNFQRFDTKDSMLSVDEPPSPRIASTRSSTPGGSSVSSTLGMCPLPESNESVRFPFFSVTLSSTSTLSFIALPVHLRPKILDAINRAWRPGIKSTNSVEYAPELMQWHKKRGCDGGVWEVTMKENCWMPRSKDKVASRRIILNIMTEMAKYGYELTSSFIATAKDTGKDTMTFTTCEPDPDPVFMGVAFYGSDRIWIIDAEADVGRALEEGIKATWVDGVRDARVRERHCRELRLRNNPWTAHSASALISARCIQITIMKLVTHNSNYKFVGAINMTDRDEPGMPLTIYRLDSSRPTAPYPRIEPISVQAKESMNIGLHPVRSQNF